MQTGARTISNNSFLIKSDRELRVAVKKRLAKDLSRYSNSYVLEELGVRHGAARIDLVAVNGYLHGYELKSDADSLYRLPGQIRLYNLVFDKLTLVVGYKNAFEAIKIIPDWWGIKLAHFDNTRNILLSSARTARKNPLQDIHSVALLLWREEALELLRTQSSQIVCHSYSKLELARVIGEAIDFDTLRTFVIQCLLKRKENLIDV